MEKEAKKYTLYYARLGDVWPTRHETVFANSEEAAVKKAFLYVGEILHAVYPKLDTEGTEYNVTGTVYYVEPNAVGRLGESSKVTEEGVAKVSLASIEERLNAAASKASLLITLLRELQSQGVIKPDTKIYNLSRGTSSWSVIKIKATSKSLKLLNRFEGVKHCWRQTAKGNIKLCITV